MSDAGADALTPLTPTSTRVLLETHGLAPRKADGQNFLVDANVVDRIVAEADLPQAAPVLEIGPGLGALTRGLLAAGHPVTAIEIDAGFVRVLEDTLGDRADLRVVHADAMDVDLDDLLPSPATPVVANLPYNVATPLLFALLAAERVGDLLLMVQAEVGDRWAARVGERAYGAVSLKLALLADVDVAFRVPATVFLPAPRVASVMVRVRRRAGAPAGDVRRQLLDLVDVCFTQPRKTLRNNLASHFASEQVDVALSSAGIDPTTRPGRLDTSHVASLHNALGAAS